MTGHAMMAESLPASPRATPKRKRDIHDETPDSTNSISYSLPTRPFSFQVPSPVSMSRSSSYQGENAQQPLNPLSIPTSGPTAILAGNSPRGVQFAEKFGTLSIDRGSSELSSMVDDISSSQLPISVQQAVEGKAKQAYFAVTKRPKLSATPSPIEIDPPTGTSSDTEILQSLRSGNRAQRSKLVDGRISKSRSPKKRRNGTPDEPVTVVDPVRAALTWQDHEITIYDPDDEDDDGTGVNGIGFKPSAAMAYARLAKRRQQLAEYRKREENEARARRQNRRRGAGPPSAIGMEPKSPSRRVRFMEPGGAPVEAK